MNYKSLLKKANKMPKAVKGRKYSKLQPLIPAIKVLREKGYTWKLIIKFLEDNGAGKFSYITIAKIAKENKINTKNTGNNEQESISNA